MRTKAKWVFVLLAASFVFGFLVFGVGAGGTGIGDVIADLLGREQQMATDEDAARERLERDPKDAEALLALATALELDGENGEAISTLERYRTLKPDDSGTLRRLAMLYLGEIEELRRESELSQGGGSDAFLTGAYTHPDSQFLSALVDNSVRRAVAGARTEAAATDYEKIRDLTGKAAGVLREIVELEPADTLFLLELAAAEEQLGNREQSLAHYRRFLEQASPDDPLAQQVRDYIETLEPSASIAPTVGSPPRVGPMPR